MDGLARRGIVGAWFAGSSTVLTSITQAVKLVVLARLLPPEDFGVVGMAMVVIACAGIAADLGLGGAVIQRDEVPPRLLSSLFWLSLVSGVLLAAGLAAASSWIALLFHEPRVAPVLSGLALLFVVQPLGALHQALAEKGLRFRRLAAIDVAASTAGSAAGIAAALSGLGVAALVLDPLSAAATRAGLLLATTREGWRPRWVFDRRGLRGYLTFGLLSVGQRTANYVTANVDYALVGGFLGASALGVYKMAYELATLTPGRLNLVVSRVFFPVLARVASDRNRFRAAFLRMQETATLLGAPIVTGIGLVAPLAIPGLLGARWLPAVPLVRILCLAGLCRVIGGTIGPALLAAGRPDLGLRWSLLVVAIQVPVLALAVSRGGTVAVAWAIAALQLLYVVLNYRFLVRTLFGPCLAAFARANLPAVALSATMAAGVAGAAAATGELGWRTALTIEVAVGAAVYLALVLTFKRRIIADLSLAAGQERAR